MARFGSLGTQYFDNSGQPLSGGLINFYESGTNTRKATYSDINLTIQNTNPVELDASGRQPNIFFAGIAKGVLTTSGGTIIETRDSVGDDNFGQAFSEWNAAFSYSEGNIVIYNGIYYASIADDNIGNIPPSSATEWEILVENILQGQTIVGAGELFLGASPSGVSGLNAKAKGVLPVGSGSTMVALSPGANGLFLRTNSSTASGLEYVAFPQIEAITTVTATAAATALLNSGITSAYSVYDLICVGTTSAASGLDLRVELAGSVISTSTYIYASTGILSGTGDVATTEAGTGAPVSSVPLAAPGGGAAQPFYLKITIISPSTGTRSTQLLIDQNTITSTGQVRRQTITAMNTGTTALTGIQLIPASGTITCTMNLYPSNL